MFKEENSRIKLNKDLNKALAIVTVCYVVLIGIMVFYFNSVKEENNLLLYKNKEKLIYQCEEYVANEDFYSLDLCIERYHLNDSDDFTKYSILRWLHYDYHMFGVDHFDYFQEKSEGRLTEEACQDLLESVKDILIDDFYLGHYSVYDFYYEKWSNEIIDYTINVLGFTNEEVMQLKIAGDFTPYIEKMMSEVQNYE